MNNFFYVSHPYGFTNKVDEINLLVSGGFLLSYYDGTYILDAADIMSFSSILPVVVSSNRHIESVLDRVKPSKVLKVYENFYLDRKLVYKEFKGDFNSYVYLIVNKLNGKIYVGSSRNLKNRVNSYLNPVHLSTYKRPVSNAIIKYGLINFAFIVLEQVDISQVHIEVRETYWIKHLKPDYNATKEAARNEGACHSEETKLAISKLKSKGSIFIYDEFKQLLVIAPSMTSLAVLLGNKSISISIKRAMKEGSLFRSSWYLASEPFNKNDKANIEEVGTEDYKILIERMVSQKHILKAIFVFKDGEFICKYNGVMYAAKELKISHNTIKESIDKNTTYKGYRFSYHRI
jgi:hypothetical protein